MFWSTDCNYKTASLYANQNSTKHGTHTHMGCKHRYRHKKDEKVQQTTWFKKKIYQIIQDLPVPLSVVK